MNRTLAALPLVSALAVLAAPSDAHAWFRGGGYIGVEHLRGQGGSVTLLQYRAEGSFALVPWFHLGLYAQGLSPLGDGKTGWGGGLLAAFRPALPGTSIDPMGYASLGFQRVPGGAGFVSSFTLELGGGAVWHVMPFFDLEARAGYVGLTGNLDGFSVAIGAALHL